MILYYFVLNLTILIIAYYFFRILNLIRCQIDPLIEYVPVVFDKLLSLLIESPVTQQQQPMNLGQTVFRTLSDLVTMTMVNKTLLNL